MGTRRSRDRAAQHLEKECPSASCDSMIPKNRTAGTKCGLCFLLLPFVLAYERSKRKDFAAAHEAEHAQPCAPLQGGLLETCIEDKLREADSLRKQYYVEAEASPGFGNRSDKLRKALDSYSSAKRDIENAWAPDALRKYWSKHVQYIYISANMASAYCDLNAPSDAIAIDEMLIDDDACATINFLVAKSPPLEKYETCSAKHLQRLILHSRHILRQPELASKWFERSKGVRFQGVNVHQWVNDWQSPAFFTPNLRSQPIWTDDLQITQFFEKNFRTFQQDFKDFLSHQVYGSLFTQNDFHLITSGSWTEHHILKHETWSRACSDILSATCKLLQSRKEFLHPLDQDRQQRGPLQASEIGYFKLDPGSRLKPHYGVTNARLICHLGLQVPEDSWLRVGQTPPRQWQVGKALCFDDSYDHEAWNNGSTPRYVLFASVRHPDVRRLPIRRRLASEL